MKKVRFSMLVLAGAVLTAMQVFGGELQWAKPGTVQPKSAATAQTSSVTLEYPVILVQNVEERQKPTAAVSKPALAPVPQAANIQKTPCDYELKSITSISYDIRRKQGEVPEECTTNAREYTGRHFDQTCYRWKASNLCTKAAYFEDVQLDRYGHSVCPAMEPIISGAKFFATVPLLPYYAGVTPPCECVYTLGHYRVGNCSPYMVQPFPISFRGALLEAGAVGGAIAVLP
ncbi:MAG: hypothetical protein LBT89_06445 [Planctomycetaceae bacterium]|jgi:hypothetical protein|nr:hypothetical protein [Planctomycetaceae bacterium]